MAEHVNFCPNCGASSKTGKAILAMDEETIYTDEEVQSIAEKLAEELRNVDEMMIDILVLKSEEYRRGPFGSPKPDWS